MINTTCTYGSTGAIVSILRDVLTKSGHVVSVCYGWNNQLPTPPNSYRLTFKGEGLISSKFGYYTGFYGHANILSTLKLKFLIRKIKPDVIHLFNLHATYINDLEVLRFIKVRKIPVLYTMFDEYPYMGRCCFSYDCEKFTTFCNDCAHLNDYPSSLYFDRSSYYFNKKREIYKDFSKLTFIGCSAVYNRAKSSALLKNSRVQLIEEPIDYDNIYYPRSSSEMRERLGIPENNKVVLTITDYGDVRKGGKYFFELYDLMKNLPQYSFVYVGYDDHKYGEKEGIITIPYVSDKGELAVYYSMADVFVFTSLADTSPNTVQQALGCGSPVCAFNIDGIRSMKLDDANVIRLSDVEDIEKLKLNVLDFERKDKLTISRCRESVYNKYNVTDVCKKYLILYKELENSL